MKKKTVSTTMLTLLIINMSILAFGIQRVQANNETVVYIEPFLSFAMLGEYFTVDVIVENVEELYGFQVNMTFDTAILTCTAVSEGPFLKQAGSTWWLPPTINNDNGWIFFACSLFPMPPNGASGTGILANVTFNVVAEGESDLHLDAPTTFLRTIRDELPFPIDHTREDGYFTTYGITVTVNITPDTLHLMSRGQWIACYIELPEGCNVGDIDIYTVMLNDTIPVALLDVPAPHPIPVEIGDYDNDIISDLMVKFDRAMVSEYILSKRIVNDYITLMITGEVDGVPFEGSDTIRVLMTGGRTRGHE